MDTQLPEAFEWLGLSVEQAQIYYDLIENGPSTLTEISQRTKIPRSSLYDHYPNLMFEGLISESSEEGRKRLQAEDPQHLRGKLHEQKASLDTLLSQYDDTHNTLESLFKTTRTRPKIKYYAGLKGIQLVLDKTLEYKEQYVMCQGDMNKGEGMERDPGFYKYYMQELAKKGIRTKEILEDVQSAREYKETYENDQRLMCLTPQLQDTDTTHIDKVIFGDFVAVFDFSRDVVLLIEDPKIAKNERIQFEMLWEKLN